MQSTLARVVRNPYLTIISRLVLGAILLLSGLAKLGVPRAMMNSIDAYDIALPRWLVGAMSNYLPAIELGLGVWLILGLFTRFSAVISAGLMLLFTAAITQAWLRGMNIDCGCFGGGDSNALGKSIILAMGPVGTALTEEKAGPVAVMRDLLFFGMAIHLLLVPSVFSLDSLRRRSYNAENVEEPEPDYIQEAVTE